jgi:type I restriction enzyme S subunit
MSNGITKRQTKNGQGFAVSRIETISQGIVDFSRVGFLTDLSPSEIENYRLHPGDILFSHINSDLHLGKTAVVSASTDPLLHGMNLLLMRVDQRKILPLFLHWLFNYYRMAGFFMSIAQHAVNQSSINQAKLKNVPIVLPPLDQQRQIVAEIEKQFTRLDAGVSGLRRVQANLERYRAAVLKAACEGKLVPTEAELARQEGRSYETGTQLLDRILTERRQKWSGRGKYKEPARPDTANLPQLPDGWTWATVEQLAAAERNSITDGPFGSNLKTEHYTATGPRVVRLQNIGDGAFVDEYAHISEEHFERLQKHGVFAGDIVIAALGDNPPRSCLIPATLGPAIVKADCIRYKPNADVAVRYVNCVLNSEPTRKRTKTIVHGVGRPRLNLGEIKSIGVPLPPSAEQERIVSEVERRLSVVEELEAVVNANFQRTTRLRQSILQRAFEGKLIDKFDQMSEGEPSELPLVAETPSTAFQRLN